MLKTRAPWQQVVEVRQNARRRKGELLPQDAGHQRPEPNVGVHSVREYAASPRPRYRLASRRDKNRLLDEFCRGTDRDRKVTIRVLRTYRNQRAATLAVPDGIRALAQIWEASDYLCSKCLAPFLPELVETL